MGRDKAAMEWEGVPMLSKIAYTISSRCDPVLVAAPPTVAPAAMPAAEPAAPAAPMPAAQPAERSPLVDRSGEAAESTCKRSLQTVPLDGCVGPHCGENLSIMF